MDNNLAYTFEKMWNGQYQVRLLGEFICYSPETNEEAIDQFLRDKGYVSRRDFLNERTRDWFDINDF